MDTESITSAAEQNEGRQNADEYAEELSLIYERQARRCGIDLPEKEEPR